MPTTGHVEVFQKACYVLECICILNDIFAINLIVILINYIINKTAYCCTKRILDIVYLIKKNDEKNSSLLVESEYYKRLVPAINRVTSVFITQVCKLYTK